MVTEILRPAEAQRHQLTDGVVGVASNGTMPGAEACRAIQRMWEALNDGDWSQNYAISDLLCSLINLQATINVFAAVEKHILKP